MIKIKTTSFFATIDRALLHRVYAAKSRRKSQAFAFSTWSCIQWLVQQTVYGDGAGEAALTLQRSFFFPLVYIVCSFRIWCMHSILNSGLQYCCSLSMKNQKNSALTSGRYIRTLHLHGLEFFSLKDKRSCWESGDRRIQKLTKTPLLFGFAGCFILQVHLMT